MISKGVEHRKVAFYVLEHTLRLIKFINDYFITEGLIVESCPIFNHHYPDQLINDTTTSHTDPGLIVNFEIYLFNLC